MKQKLITTAIAAALIAASGSVSALTPDQILSGVVGNNSGLYVQESYITGSSTQDALILAGIRDQCYVDQSSPYTLDVYILGSGGDQTMAFACFDPINGGLINIIHKSTNDSAAGMAAVGSQTPLTYIDVTAQYPYSATPVSYLSAYCTQGKGSPVFVPAIGGYYTPWTCPNYTKTKTAVPSSTLSDFDPAFAGLQNANVSASNSLQKTYGVAVTVALRNALQQAQGLTVGSDLAVDTPNLPIATLAGFFSAARMKTAADLDIAGDTTPVYLLRMVSNSDTQKITEAFFFSNGIRTAIISGRSFRNPTLNYNGLPASDATCGTNAAAPSMPPAPTVTPVYGGVTDEDVVNCLNRHNAGHRYAIASLPMTFNAFATPASPSWNIDQNPTYPTGFRYVKLDNSLPTVENVIRGNYEFYAEGGKFTMYQSIYTPNDGMWGGYTTGSNSLFTQWTDLPAGFQTSGFVVPGNAASCQGTFAALGTTPDAAPVNSTTKNSTSASISNGMKPIAVCPPRF